MCRYFFLHHKKITFFSCKFIGTYIHIKYYSLLLPCFYPKTIFPVFFYYFYYLLYSWFVTPAEIKFQIVRQQWKLWQIKKSTVKLLNILVAFASDKIVSVKLKLKQGLCKGCYIKRCEVWDVRKHTMQIHIYISIQIWSGIYCIRSFVHSCKHIS